MRWGDMRRSENVEDRTAGGGGGGFPIGGIPLSGGALILIVVVSLLFGVNPLEMLGLMGGSGPAPQQQSVPPGYGPQTGPTQSARPQDPRNEFVSRVLGDLEDFWGQTFKTMGGQYAPPRLVLFRGATQSACGVARSATGPFYCPGDREVYLDTAFFDELRTRFGAPGEFAAAYVIAHEVGHHVQNLMGYSKLVDEKRRALTEEEFNPWSVRMELQADYLAGVWAHHGQEKFHFIQKGDVESAIKTANSIGDDRIQKRTQGMVVPDAFTHGTAEQRARWFKTGFNSGDVRSCDTFSQ